MAWGYEKCFTIEHDTTVKKKIDCKDCVYYEKSDKSCMKRPLYLPEDGYESWRKCKYFELDKATSQYEIKNQQYKEFLQRKKKNESGDSSESTKKVGVLWLKAGKSIYHNTYKQGKVISNDGKHIRVRFDSSPETIRQLDIQICIKNGIIKALK